MTEMNELLDAVGKLVQAKGRFHTEQNYKALVAAYDRARAGQAASAPADIRAKDHPVRECIDGAILQGRVGEAGPPTTDHWLYEYWRIGQQLSKLGETSVWDNVTPADDAPAAASAPQGQAESDAQHRLAVAYEAVGRAIGNWDVDINLTRLYDWLGGELGMNPAALTCAAQESAEGQAGPVADGPTRADIAAMAQVRYPDEWPLGVPAMNAQAVERDAERYRWIEDNCQTSGGGRGFEITCWVPFDEEDMGVGVDRAIASMTKENES